MASGLKDLEPAAWAGPLTAALAVASAAWFGFLSAGARIMYGSVGVAPREIGLGSAQVLAQASSSVILVGAIVALGFVLTMTRGSRRQPSLLVAIIVGVAFALSCVLALMSGVTGRSHLLAGERMNPLSPWTAEVASLAWADKPSSGFGDLPLCVLYLGRAEGTTVVYDPDDKHRRTLRIPSSLIIVTHEVDKDRC